MFPDIIKQDLLEHLSQLHNTNVVIENTSVLSGGSINDAYKVVTNSGTYFVKYNLASTYPNMFETEARGLNILRASNSIIIPEFYFVNTIGDYAYLVLEYIESSITSSKFWQNFGYSLAGLHKTSNASFGLDHNNYIGSLKQSNNFHSSWVEFFINERLTPQLKMAVDKGLIEQSTQNAFTALFLKLPLLLPEEQPALLHGDLWSGNFMIANNGEACIMDPAVYFGCREMDLAMSKLFGGFDHAFYNAYNEVYPLIEGWHERVDIHNIYPLLVHVNLFGRSYLNTIKGILKRFN